METRVYPNKLRSSFEVGFDVTDKECEEQRKKRAERFGFVTEEVSMETAVDLDQLPKELPEGSGGVRDGAIFVLGVNDMSTDDVMGIFQVYAPKHLEWINDTSCVVMWKDPLSAKRALFSVGKWPMPCLTATKGEVTSGSSGSSSSDSGDRGLENSDSSHDSGVATEDSDAQKVEWRVAQPTGKAKYLLLRLATQGDRKKRGAAKESEYYVKYGNPHTGQRGAVTLDQLRSRARKRQRDTGEDEEEEPPKVARPPPRPLPKSRRERKEEEHLTITIDGNTVSAGGDPMEVDDDEEDLNPRRMASAVVAVKPIISVSDTKCRLRLHADDMMSKSHHGELMDIDRVEPMEIDTGLTVTVEGAGGQSGASDLRSHLAKRRAQKKEGSRLQVETSSDGRSIAIKRRPNEVTALVVKLM